MAGLSRHELWAALTPVLRASARRLDAGAGGIAEDAFPVGMADPVLQTLEVARAVVLGGDFYEMAGENPRPTGMDWHYEGDDSAESVIGARDALQQRWVAGNWLVTFIWR